MSNNKIDDLMKNVTMSEELKESIRNNTVNSQKVISVRKRPSKRILLVATLCIAALGTLTVTAANNAGKWQKYLADMFGVDEKQQQELIDDGYAQDKEVNRHEDDILSVTENGITMTVKQTIMDKNTLVILLHAKSENGIELNDECVLGDVTVDMPLKDGMYCYYGGGDMATNTPYEKWYVITYSCTTDDDSIENGDKIDLTVRNINNIAEDEEVMIEGQWKLSWMLDVNESVAKVQVNQAIEANGCRYYVDNLEITPMSLKVRYSEKREILDENMDYVDGFITYYNPETGLTEFAYAGLDIDLVMKDGTVYENVAGHSGGTNLGDEESSEIDIWNMQQIIDIDELKSVLIEGKEYMVTAD